MANTEYITIRNASRKVLNRMRQIGVDKAAPSGNPEALGRRRVQELGNCSTLNNGRLRPNFQVLNR